MKSKVGKGANKSSPQWGNFHSIFSHIREERILVGPNRKHPHPYFFSHFFLPNQTMGNSYIFSTPFPFLSFHTQHIFSSGFFTFQHFFFRKRKKLYWKTWPCRLFYFYQTRLSLCYDFLLLSTWLIWWLIRQASLDSSYIVRVKFLRSDGPFSLFWDPLILLLKE